MFSTLIFALTAMTSSSMGAPVPSSGTLPTLVSAQKAYVAGDWKLATTSFDAVCPTLPENERAECALWGILALSQTGNSTDFTRAALRLDSLIQASSPKTRVYSDLFMTKAQFELYLGKNEKAFASWKHAYEAAEPRQYAVLSQVCESIQKNFNNDEVSEFCGKVKKTPPISKAPSETTGTPSLSSSSIPATTVEPVAVSSSTATAGLTSVKEGWAIQLGAFSIRESAQILVDNFRKRSITVHITEKVTAEKTLYLVQTASFPSREAAMDYGARTFAPLNLDFIPVKIP
jgi:hypothetical protein